LENVEDAGGKVVQASADRAYDENDKNEGAIQQRKNPRKGYAHESREPSYESWHDKYKHGRQWYAKSTFSAVKRKSGEFERATKAKNMSNEIKLKYIFYNTIIKYDMPHTSFFASPI